MWERARRAMPEDFDAAKKVVQALSALARADEAERAMEEVRRTFRASTDVAVKRQVQVVIDQLVVGGRKVMVQEALASTSPDLHYHWTALVFDAEGKKPVFSVQLESSAYGRETGLPFLSGISRADRCTAPSARGTRRCRPTRRDARPRSSASRRSSATEPSSQGAGTSSPAASGAGRPWAQASGIVGSPRLISTADSD
jgi:hypothetical protein